MGCPIFDSQAWDARELSHVIGDQANIKGKSMRGNQGVKGSDGQALPLQVGSDLAIRQRGLYRETRDVQGQNAWRAT